LPLFSKMTQIDPKYGQEARKTLSLAIPIVIGQLGVVLLGVTDNILVGRFLGTTALGASGIANSISFLLASIAVGGMSVVAPMISKARAMGNAAEINRSFRASIWVSVVLCVLLSVPGFVCATNFHWFGQSPEVTRLGSDFLHILTASNLFLFLFVALKQLPDGLSQTKVAMLVTLLGLVCNFVFNLALIQGLWGFPRMGINGSALATLLTRVLMASTLLLYILRDQRFEPYLKKAYNSLNINDLILKVFRLGIPTGLQFFFEIAAFTIAVIMMGWLGEDRLAAHQIVINIAAVTYMMASGLAYSGSIRVGEGLGLQDWAAIRRSGTVAIALSAAFMGFCMALMILFDRFWVGLYISDPKVLDIGLKLLLIAAFFQLSDGFQVVAAGALRGLADVNVPTLISLVAYWVVALPLGWYLAFPLGWDAPGIWVGLWAGLTMAAILLTTRFYKLSVKS
jgi:multidrug resistance protein, MATE family